MRYRTLNHSVESPIHRATKKQSASSGRGRALLPLAITSVLLVSVSLPGCSAQKRPRSARDEQAILASDSPSPLRATDSSEGMDYDPWESFNEKTFSFNFNVLDRYALKPAAKVWAKALPEPVRQSLANAFDNVAMPRRFVNK